MKVLDSDANSFLIVAFDDKKDNKNKVHHRTLRPGDISKNFGLMNSSNSYGLFVTVNKFKDNRRVLENFISARAVFCEYDKKDGKPSFPIPPNIIVNSSPGKYHFYWLTETDNLEEWNGVQQQIVEKYDGDKNARDACRVLRIPGFFHNKGEPFMVTFETNPKQKRYEWEEVRNAFNPNNILSVPEEETSSSTSSQSYEDHNQDIIEGDHFHGPTLAYLQMLKDGTNPAAVKSLIKTLFDNSKASSPDHWNHNNWKLCYSEIDSQVDSYARKLNNDRINAEDIVGEFEVDTRRNSDVDRLPDNILAPPGTLIGDLTRELHKIWWVPNMMVSALTARAAISYLAGGNYKSNIGDRINLQQCAVGETGCGKDLIVTGLPKIIQQAFIEDDNMLSKLLHGVIDEAGSAEGLDDRLRSLGDKHDIIFVKDEMGELMQQSVKGNQTKQGIFNYFLRMYTKSDQVSNERARAKQRNESQNSILYAPHFIVSGASTPDLMLDGMSSSQIGTGLMSRLMLFDASLYKEKPQRQIPDFNLSDEIMASLRMIVDTSIMEGMFYNMPSARIYNPKIVTFNEDAIDYCYEEILKDANREKDSRIYNRRVPNAKKYAMCEAILENPVEPVVMLENMKRQIKFINHSCMFTTKLFTENVGDGDSDLVRKGIKAKLGKGKKKWIKRGVMINIAAAKKVDVRLLNAVIADMIENDEIECETIENLRGKPTKLFRLSQ